MAATALKVNCEHCGNEFRVKPEAAGRSVRCPECRERTTVSAGGSNGDGGLEWPEATAPTEPPPSPQQPPEPPASNETRFPTPFPTIHPAVESNEKRTVSIARHGENSPRRYPALRVVQIAFYVLAGLVMLQWLVFAGITLIAMVGSMGSSSPEWPEEVPAGASIFDPDLTDEQREKLGEYNAAEMRGNASGFMAGASIITLLLNTMATAVSVCLLVAVGELIRVLLDVQEDTRRSAMYAARVATA